MIQTNEFLKHIIALYQQIHRDDYVMIVDRDYQICFISQRFALSMATTSEQLQYRKKLKVVLKRRLNIISVVFILMNF